MVVILFIVVNMDTKILKSITIQKLDTQFNVKLKVKITKLS